MVHLLRHPYTREAGLLFVLLISALALTALAYRLPRAVAYPANAPPTLLPLEDFHAVEQYSDDSGVFRWTSERSSLALPNPGGSPVIRLTLAGGGRTVPTTLQTRGTRLEFEVQPPLRTYSLLLPPQSGERVLLTLAAPTTADDGRSLGVMLRSAAVSGGGSAPGYMVLALLLATACGYALLRQARVPPLAAAGWIVAAQVAVLAVQAAFGWRYGLLVPLLLLVSLASAGALVAERWLLARATAAPGDAHSHAQVDIRFWPLAVVLLLTLAVRLPWLDAPDPVGDLELAARRMGLLYERGLQGAYVFDGDYVPLRLYLLAGLSRLVVLFGGDFTAPLPFVTKFFIKLPGLLADLAVISILYTWSLRWLPARRAALVAALYALAPPVWINVAWWGQVDTLLMLPLVGMVVLFERAGGRWAWLCWATALLIKPQAIVFAPLLYVATLRLHGSRGLAQGGALAVALVALVSTPLLLAGQGPGLALAYLGSVGRFPHLTAGAYNLWYLITLGDGGHDTALHIGGLGARTVGVLLAGGVAALVGASLLRRADGPARAEGAAVLALAFFALPTQIHERYLFLTLAFLALCIASNERMVIPLVVLVFSATLNIFGTLDGFIPALTSIIADSPLPLLLAVVNLGTLALLTGHLLLHSYGQTTPRWLPRLPAAPIETPADRAGR